MLPLGMVIRQAPSLTATVTPPSFSGVTSNSWPSHDRGVTARATKGETQPVEGDQAPSAREDATATLPAGTTPYTSLRPTLLSPGGRRGHGATQRVTVPAAVSTAATGTPIPGVKLFSPAVATSPGGDNRGRVVARDLRR